MSFLDNVVAFAKVIASALAGPSSEVVYNMTAGGGFKLDAQGNVVEDDSDEAGEQATDQVGYGPLGWIGRPLPPDGIEFAEAACLRNDDGLAPFGWRDPRINRALNPGGSGGTPAPGQLLFAGYHGAFLSHAAQDDGSTISTWYVPHDFDADGVPAKAHTISIDPTPGNSSISIVHASGLFLQLTENTGGGAPGIVAAVDDTTFARIKPGEVWIQASKIMLKGNVYLGAQAEAGLPLLAGAASPPSPSVFVSPV